jgi:hypothetical protein
MPLPTMNSSAWLDVEKYRPLIESAFIATAPNGVSLKQRLAFRVGNAMYQRTRRQIERQSTRLLKAQMPEIVEIQLKAREAGGLSGDYQFVRLWELAHLLAELRPTNALELGSGASSAIFASYFKDASKFTTVEENPQWRDRARAAWGAYAPHINSILASRKLDTAEGKPVCSYDISHQEEYDLIYVDGPYAILHGEAAPDGKTFVMACVDIELFWKNDRWPRYIVVDGRRDTLRRFIFNGQERYRILLRTDLLPHTNFSIYNEYRYHSIFVRNS